MKRHTTHPLETKRQIHWAWMALLAALLSAGLLAERAYAQGEFHVLGTLGGSYTETWSLSADGSTVVGRSQNADGHSEACVWRASTGMIGLGTFGGNTSAARAVSADGSTVVGWAMTRARGRHPSRQEAFLWTDSSGMISLGTLGGDTSIAHAVSADGTIVAGRSRNAGGDWEAFLWTASSGMMGLGTEVSNNSLIRLSKDGNVVAGGGSNPLVAWSASKGAFELGSLGGNTSSVAGLSFDGSVIVGRSGSRAFAWTDSTDSPGMFDLGTLGGSWADALDVSADGETIVGYSGTVSSGQQAFVWDSVNGMRQLENPLEEDYHADAWQVSSDGGRISGSIWSKNDSRDVEGVVWDRKDDGEYEIRSLAEVLAGEDINLEVEGMGIITPADGGFWSDDLRTVLTWFVTPNNQFWPCVAILDPGDPGDPGDPSDPPEDPSDPPEPGLVFVDDVTYSTSGGPNKDRHLHVEVFLSDADENALAGANVAVFVLHDGDPYDIAAGTTNDQGVFSFSISNAPSGTWSTIVDTVDGVELHPDETPPNSFTK